MEKLPRMTHMLKILLPISFGLFIHLKSFGQGIESEIKSLTTKSEIEAYWQIIKDLDQKLRGPETSDSNDNSNFKKVIITLKYHGFPAHSKIPILVAIHQKSAWVNEYYFPIFYSAYQAGKADSAWFFHYLRGIYRNRFDRDLVRGRPIEAKDVKLFLAQLSPFLKLECDFSIEPFDSLFNRHIEELNKLRNHDTLGIWKNEQNDRIYLFSHSGKFHFLKIWRDNSHSLPQEVFSNQNQTRFDFTSKKYNDYVLIEGRNLIYHQEFKPTEIYSLKTRKSLGKP
ncbi:hypothetical protein MASR2M44_22720 [Bacteroidota bacterium]